MRKGFLCALVVPVCLVSSSYAQSPATSSVASGELGCAQVKFDELCGTPTCRTSWFKVDYLTWWTKNSPLPGPVLTSGTPASNGILGDPDTTLFYAPGSLNYDVLQGGRLTWGMWFDPCQKWGVEVSGFALETGSTHFSASSDATGAPLIAFPVFDGQRDTPSSQVVANLNQFAGAVDVSSRQHFWGIEANLLRNAWTGCNSRLDFIFGYRQLGLAESMQQNSASLILENGVAGYLGEVLQPGEAVAIADQIKTNNHFYGGQIGARYTHSLGNLDLSLAGTVALGWTHESFELGGNTSAVRLDGSVDFTPLGGLYVLGTNAGLTDRNRFSYVPEVRADAVYHFTDRLSVGVGYTFIYWSNVARPGNQIDPVIDRQQQPSSVNYDPTLAATHPARRDTDTSFWAQGLSLQVGIRY